MDATIANLRREYAKQALDEQSVAAEPLAQFRIWFDAALASGIVEPNAMLLSTADADGRPSARVVLLKDIDDRGLSFYTNYNSRKADDIAANPRVSLTFWWQELERQVRVEGRAEQLAESESDLYFASRPRGSRLGAWASPQSAVVTSREELEHALEEVETRFGDGDVARPPHWGGYRVVPDVVEFWQGRPARLHDRIRYRRSSDKWLDRKSTRLNSSHVAISY